MKTYTTTNVTNDADWLYKSCCCSLPYSECCGRQAVSVPSVWTDPTDLGTFGYDQSTITWPPVKEGRIKRAVKAFLAAWKE